MYLQLLHLENHNALNEMLVICINLTGLLLFFYLLIQKFVHNVYNYKRKFLSNIVIKTVPLVLPIPYEQQYILSVSCCFLTFHNLQFIIQNSIFAFIACKNNQNALFEICTTCIILIITYFFILFIKSLHSVFLIIKGNL